MWFATQNKQEFLESVHQNQNPILDWLLIEA